MRQRLGSESSLSHKERNFQVEVLREYPPNMPMLSDKSMPSCLLQKVQKPRQHAFAPDQGSYENACQARALLWQSLWMQLNYTVERYNCSDI